METVTPSPLLDLLEARSITRGEFNQKIERLTGRLDRLEDRAAREVRGLLRTVDREIRDGIISFRDTDDLSRGDLNRVIDQAVDRFVDQRRFVMQRSTRQAEELAFEFRQNVAKIGGQEVKPAPLSRKLGDDLREIQDEANKAFGQDLRAKIKLEIAQGVSKGMTPRQIARELVAKRVVTPSRPVEDPHAHGALARAEGLARLDVRQTFNAVNFVQSKAQGISGARKIWVSMRDKVTREAHLLAGRDYTVGGRIGPIPVGQNFIVGGEPLMFPQDPKGSSGNVINCRCVMVELLPAVADEIDSRGGAFK